GRRKTISSREWLDLWPMFATNRADGPDRAFHEVQVFEAISSETPHTQLLSDCIAWLKEQSIAGLDEKKLTFYEDARPKAWLCVNTRYIRRRLSRCFCSWAR